LLINIFSFIIGSEIPFFEGGKLTQILHRNKTIFGKANIKTYISSISTLQIKDPPCGNPEV
jgi:hypothetical protein